jgi:Trk-type K+ transport system membrane component
MSLSTVRRVVFGTVLVSLTVEVGVTIVLAGRLWLGRDYPFGRALWFGLFHAVAAFNNAGFSLWPDKLVSVATDSVIILPIAVALIVGGLGFPVVFDIVRVRPPRTWSVHTKTTLAVTSALLILGPLVLILNEWHNPHTLGALDIPGRILAGGFSGITPRTAGLGAIDYSQSSQATLLFTEILMFIGGGSGSTAGGIKVTTIAVLLMAVVSEARGDRDVEVFGRRISPSTIRQAIAVATLGMIVLLGASLMLLEISNLPLDHVLFEVTSALCTVGLSTGITPHLPATGQYLLIALMYLGRIGSITVVTAFALRSTSRAYRHPEGRPFIG